MAQDKDKRKIQSIERVAEILDYLSLRPRGERLTTISKELLLNKSTAFGIISTLEQLGYVEQDQDTARYVLGLKLFELGQAAYSRLELTTVAKPHISKLAQKCEETVHIAVLSGTEVVYLDKVESPRAMRVSSQIGGREPVHCTGLGKVLLAFLPKSNAEDIIKKIDYVKCTENTITTEKDLRRELEDIKKHKFALDREENEEGLYCIAAPIFNGRGEVVAALSVAGTVERVKNEGGDKLIEEVKETALAISISMGYR